MGDVHHCSRAPVSEMTYTVSSGTLNSTIPYHTLICSCLHYITLYMYAINVCAVMGAAGEYQCRVAGDRAFEIDCHDRRISILSALFSFVQSQNGLADSLTATQCAQVPASCQLSTGHPITACDDRSWCSFGQDVFNITSCLRSSSGNVINFIKVTYLCNGK